MFPATSTYICSPVPRCHGGKPNWPKSLSRCGTARSGYSDLLGRAVVIRAPAVAYHDLGAFDLRHGFGEDAGEFLLGGDLLLLVRRAGHKHAGVGAPAPQFV
jgi:hypothetical protein